MKYRAFISYGHDNERWARWIHRALELYRLPRNFVPPSGDVRSRLKPVFPDRDELGSSSSLSASIREALADSEALIVLCSPSAAASKWVNQEVREFASLHGGKHVLGVATGLILDALQGFFCVYGLREPQPFKTKCFGIHGVSF